MFDNTMTGNRVQVDETHEMVRSNNEREYYTYEVSYDMKDVNDHLDISDLTYCSSGFPPAGGDAVTCCNRLHRP